MNATRKSPTRYWLRLGLILPLLMAGCLWHKVPGVDKASDIVPGAIPQPVGTYVKEFAFRQGARARLDEFVIYLYEWQMGTPDFGPFGARHIEQIAHRLPTAPAPVVIEPENDPDLNEARRNVVINYLTEHGCPDAEARVTTGFPQAEGLYGDEAPHIYRQMIAPRLGNSSSGNNQNPNSNSNTGGILNGVSGSGGLAGGLGGVGVEGR